LNESLIAQRTPKSQPDILFCEILAFSSIFCLEISFTTLFRIKLQQHIRYKGILQNTHHKTRRTETS